MWLCDFFRRVLPDLSFWDKSQTTFENSLSHRQMVPYSDIAKLQPITEVEIQLLLRSSAFSGLCWAKSGNPPNLISWKRYVQESPIPALLDRKQDILALFGNCWFRWGRMPGGMCRDIEKSLLRVSLRQTQTIPLNVQQLCCGLCGWVSCMFCRAATAITSTFICRVSAYYFQD